MSPSSSCSPHAPRHSVGRLWPILVALLVLQACDSSDPANVSTRPDTLQGEDTSPPDISEDMEDTRDTTDLSVDTAPNPWCGDESCATGEACCDAICVNPRDTLEHCGGCGRACDLGEACIDGVCECAGGQCAVNEQCCPGGDGTPGCIDVYSDVAQCGACGAACGDDERCIGGSCLCQGPAGLESCGDAETCCPGAGCIDMETDARHCGGCGLSCGPGELCQDARCECGGETGPVGGFACGAGQQCCGSPATCHPATAAECACGSSLCSSGEECCGDAGAESCSRLDRDEENCGACGVSCGDAERCITGACRCDAGFGDCDGDRDNGCETALEVNIAHCGACGNACEVGEVCAGGVCALNCQPGYEVCSGACVELSFDDRNCGVCDNACGSGEVCNGYGECALTCGDNLTICNGTCVNTDFMVDHCGGCGDACSAGEVCDGGGRCELSCPSALTDCQRSCADLDTNRWNCGGCGDICDPGDVCRGDGTCAVECLTDRTECNGTCIDTETSDQHCGACGNACVAGEACAGGDCLPNCGANLTACGGACVDLQTDPSHCDGCDQACSGAEVCLAGHCELLCPEGWMACDGDCIDTQTRQDHCGTCNNDCSSGTFCDRGFCVGLGSEGPQPTACTDPEIWCDDACSDLSTDGANCGACNEPCAGNTQCSGGACIPACSSGASLCPPVVGVGQCVMTLSDRNNCGDCGNICAPGERCDQGSCVPLCDPDPYDLCGGECVNTNNDRNNCGDCDTVCALGRLCSGGGCVCETFLGDCGGGDDCETDLRTSAANCGACFNDCVNTGPNLTCRQGQCVPTNGRTISAGRFSTCQINSANDVYCMGRSTDGALGGGCIEPSCLNQDSPGKVLGLVSNSTVSIVGSSYHTDHDGITEELDYHCALVSNEVFCWGSGYEGVLGNRCGETDGPAICEPVTTPTSQVLDDEGQVLENVSQISTNNGHTCALVGTEVHCWGAGAQSYAVEFTELLGIPLEIAAGRIEAGPHACALLTTGAVQCWGDNSLGQLGSLDPSATQNTPLSSGVKRIASGLNAVCALHDNGTVSCWGDCQNGATGLSRDACTMQGFVHEPLLVPNLASSPVIDLVAGQSNICALQENNEVRCWGAPLCPPDDFDCNPEHLLAVIDGFSAPIIDLAISGGHACARLKDDEQGDPRSLECWGENGSGTLGVLHPRTFFPIPRPTAGLDSPASFAGNSSSLCALEGNQIRCTGDNQNGQLGVVGQPPPGALVTVSGGHTWSALEGSEDFMFSPQGHYCAIDSGALWCWGSGQQGQFGEGCMSGSCTEHSSTPIQVPIVGTVLSADLTSDHSCAITDNAGTLEVYCWGAGQEGQLGDGIDHSSDEEYHPPREVFGLIDPNEIVVGAQHSCARTGEQNDPTNEGSTEVWCWGSDATGQLGHGTVGGSSNAPLKVDGIPDPDTFITSIEANGFGTCALQSDGKVWCWGLGNDGDLGAIGPDISPPAEFFPPPNGIVLDIERGYSVTCVRTDAEEVHCRGVDFSAQRGIHPQGNFFPTDLLNQVMITPPSGASIVRFDMTGIAACVTFSDNSAACWGPNFSLQLPLDYTLFAEDPVQSTPPTPP